jgi:hypothetical protein
MRSCRHPKECHSPDDRVVDPAMPISNASGVPVASSDVNQVKSRLQSLGLLDRAFANATDEDLQAAVDVLSDEQREALDELAGGAATPESIRDAISSGRLDGTMESAALVLTDACLAECIEQLGEHADRPTTEQLREVLPGLCDAHGKAITQLMLASTVAGEAPAAAIIRDLLKNDDEMKLPKAEPKPISPIVQGPAVDPDERAAIKAKRQEMKQRKQAEARARREQAEGAKRR